MARKKGTLGMEEGKMLRLLSLGVFVYLLGGCASYGVVENAPGPAPEGGPSYSIGGKIIGVTIGIQMEI